MNYDFTLANIMKKVENIGAAYVRIIAAILNRFCVIGNWYWLFAIRLK